VSQVQVKPIEPEPVSASPSKTVALKEPHIPQCVVSPTELPQGALTTIPVLIKSPTIPLVEKLTAISEVTHHPTDNEPKPLPPSVIHLIGQTLDTLIQDLTSQPSTITPAVLGVSQQLGHTTSALSDIATDLIDLLGLLRDKPSEVHNLTGLHRELQSLNVNLGLQRDEVAKLRGVIRSLVDLQRSNWPKQSAQTEALTMALSTFSATMTQLSSVIGRQVFPQASNSTPTDLAPIGTPSTEPGTRITPLLPSWNDTSAPRRNSGPWRNNNPRTRRREYHYGNQYKNLRAEKK